jgi:flagellar basal-body rod protein FlgF
MNLPSLIAISSLAAQQRELEVTANNLANANTPGVRAERVLFNDWLSRSADPATPFQGRITAFTQDRATWRDTAEGALTQTANPLDLAIKGDGYFTVQTPNGPRLTRAGKFAPSSTGVLADQAGNALLDVTGQPIQLADGDTAVTVSGDGTVSGLGGTVGQIGMVTPADPARLVQEGEDNLRADTPTSPSTNSSMVQGTLEDSNVQPILETTRMMSLVRQFQFVSQFVQAESDRQQYAIDHILQGAS